MRQNPKPTRVESKRPTPGQERARSTPRFEVIVLAVDHSKHSSVAIDAAADVSKAFDSEVIVVHALDILVSAPVGADATSMPLLVAEDQLAFLQQEMGVDAQRFVTGVAQKLAHRGVQARGIVISGGSTAKLILDAARDYHAGLIVVGSHGLSDLTGLLLGTVAHQVVQHAHCPVLIVR